MDAAIEAGAVFVVDQYPFVLEDVSLPPDDPEATDMVYTKSWRPGVRYEMVYPDDSEAVCDGLGKQIITVISTHKPSPFPERVFYTRQWEDPTGKRFGKNKLLITVKSRFKQLIAGYGSCLSDAEREFRVAGVCND